MVTNHANVITRCQFYLDSAQRPDTVRVDLHHVSAGISTATHSPTRVLCTNTQFMAVPCLTASGRQATSCQFLCRVVTVHGRRPPVIVASTKKYVEPIGHFHSPSGFRYIRREAGENPALPSVPLHMYYIFIHNPCDSGMCQQS
jgi:hypothetical protein